MERYRLSELATLSGVSARTIRYYIAERLLPAPVGQGPTAYYTNEHRERLTLIQQLKGEYLSLQAIRGHLAHLPTTQPEEPTTNSQANPNASELWQRIVLREGVELHLRLDLLSASGPLAPLVEEARRLFSPPASP